MSEQIIHDYSLHSRMRFTVLRYFNPAGAHDSGRLGEIPFREARQIWFRSSLKLPLENDRR